jgi:hypothetical protein
MNYNNPYFNPYNQYPYSQPQQPQTNYLPLTFISGIEGAKAFIVAPNQVVYLKDSDSNILYEKRADAQGRYSLTAYEMKPVNDTSKQQSEFATTSDLTALKSMLTEKIDILSKDVETLLNGAKKGE